MSESESHRNLPAWYDEVSASLAYADHLVFSGNTNDVFPSLTTPENRFLSFEETLWELLQAAGIEGLVRYDPVEGVTVPKATSEAARSALSAHFEREARETSEVPLSELHAAAVEFSDFRICFLVNYASHLRGRDGHDESDLFVRIDHNSSKQRRPGTKGPLNTTIWMVDQPADLPDWFVLKNALLREIQIEGPNLEDRFAFASHLADMHGWCADLSPEDQKHQLQQFALECDGKPLAAMDAIAKVAEAETLGLAGISDAIRIFRTGSRRNPWTSPVLRSRMEDARAILESRIKGQPFAIEKSLDILSRSILGLSGVQSSSMHTRPRGGLFFVGPTGVGKTELAKSITELLFGDETLCHRFDMSEFKEERSVARLIGAPPGHADHEKGGELVNAVLRRPFSVFLFDEVEKAHPRVLDLFLQILDEGRLTDARGATAYFSEALIIFTSNVGIAKGSRETNMGMNVLPSDSHAELSRKIQRAVDDHFRIELQRPELLNRIGQNIVVFDFLSPEGMSAIFDATLDRVLRNIQIEQHVQISMSAEVRSKLKSLCTRDFFDGGRGIANRIETHLINPIARQIFEVGNMDSLHITSLDALEGQTMIGIDRGIKQPQSVSGVHPVHPSIKPLQRIRRPTAGKGNWRERLEKP